MSGTVTVLETLQEIVDLLSDPASGCAVSPAPCRISVYPGPEAVYDSCSESLCDGGDGQLWANVVEHSVVDSGGGCVAINWTAHVGIVRCAAGPGDDGSPPTVEAVSADAWQQAADADAIRRALMCCEARSERVRGTVLRDWQAVADGDCVGGVWTIQGKVDTCC